MSSGNSSKLFGRPERYGTITTTVLPQNLYKNDS